MRVLRPRGSERMREPLLRRAPAHTWGPVSPRSQKGAGDLGRRGGRCTMPGMVLFGRRWSLASDDLVFPGSFELFLRVLS